MGALSLPGITLLRHAASAREKREHTNGEVAPLATRMRENGLVEPRVVTPDGDNYTVLAPHR